MHFFKVEELKVDSYGVVEFACMTSTELAVSSDVTCIAVCVTGVLTSVVVVVVMLTVVISAVAFFIVSVVVIRNGLLQLVKRC